VKVTACWRSFQILRRWCKGLVTNANSHPQKRVRQPTDVDFTYNSYPLPSTQSIKRHIRRGGCHWTPLHGKLTRQSTELSSNWCHVVTVWLPPCLWRRHRLPCELDSTRKIITRRCGLEKRAEKRQEYIFVWKKRGYINQ
jgi:hypothetical protein